MSTNPVNNSRRLAVRDIIASIVLASFSVAALASFVRVYDSWKFAGAVLGSALIVHLFSLTLRLLRVPGWPLIVLLPLFGGWVFLLLQYPSTLRAGLPTGETISAVADSIDQVVFEFPNAIAPVPMDTAWLSVGVAAAILVAVISELFAFPARAIGESLAPGAFVFVLIAALGDERYQFRLTMLLIVAGTVAVAALGWHHDRTIRLGQQRPAFLSAAPMVFAVAFAVAAAAGAIGPRLPGAGEDPVIDPTTGSGRSVTTIVSPMVELRSRLTNQSRTEMFSVSAQAPSYWRSTTLPEFDGEAFKLPARSLDEVGQPDAEIENPNRQQIQVGALGDRTVPAAAEPQQADGTNAEGEQVRLRINRDTSTLIAPDDLKPGDTYTVVSSTAQHTPDELRASSATSVDVDPIYLSVPEDLPATVAELAADVTEGQPTDYDKLLALQNWFRTDFDYSLDVQPSHNTSAIEQFLSARTGYCEQFSATFAAMARTLGMPSRVAVGFTTGERSGERFTVRGANAHAWPEILFEGVGWVAFEPTPGRGIPGAEEYTGVAAPEDTATDDTTPPTTVPGSQPAPTARPKPTPGTKPPTPATAPPAATGASGDGNGVGWGWPLFALAAVALLVAAPALARRAIRARQVHLPPAQSAIVAWRRSQRALRRAGASLSASATTSDWVAAASTTLPIAAQPMRSLGEAFDIACYGPVESSSRIAPDQVTNWADEVEQISDDALTTKQRVTRWFRID